MIELPRAPMRFFAAARQCGVDVDRVRIERDGLAAPDETCWVRRGQRSTESKEGLPEATARLGLRSIAAEKRRELVPRVGLPRGPREVSQQRLGLAGAEPQRRPGSEPGLEVAQEHECEPHRLPALACRITPRRHARNPGTLCASEGTVHESATPSGASVM
jgi:hypothetical protein